jgi:hypothetical protein
MNTVTGIFTKATQAKDAFAELEDRGFHRDRVSALMSDQTKGRAFTIEKTSKAGAGAAIGGSLTGLAAAIAVGLAAVGSLTIPGINLVAVGPIVAALTGAGVGAAAGGLIGALIGLGIPEYEAKIYEKKIKEGGVLIAVEVRNSDEERTVKEIFQSNEAKDIAA